MAQALAVSNHSKFWQADATDGDILSSAPGCSRTYGRGLDASQGAHETAASRVHKNGAAASVPVCDGRRAKQKSHFWFRAGEDGFSGSSAEGNLGRPGNGRVAPAAVGAGGLGEFRGVAVGKSAGESELHGLRGNAGLVHSSVPDQNRRHVARLSGQAENQSFRRGGVSGRRGSEFPLQAARALGTA